MQIEYLADHPEFTRTLAAWFHAQWGHLSPGRTAEMLAEELKSHLHHDELPLALIALSGAEVVGSASLRVHDMHTRRDLSPWLASVYVPAEHRRQGIGARLVTAIEEKAKAMGFAVLYLWTEEKEHFYAQLGWAVVDRVEYLGEHAVIMQKQLRNKTA